MLSSLPAELLLHIITYIDSAAHLNSLLRTCHRFVQICSQLLFQRALATVDARNGRSVLHWATATGRDRLLGSLLTAGANVNVLDKSDISPLGSAVLRGSEMAVTRLLQSGAAIEHKTREGRTALHVAVITGNDVMARLLLQHGADVRALSGAVLKMNPLHYAVMLGHVHMVKLLLEHGAKMDTHDRIGGAIARYPSGPARDEILGLLFGTGEDAASLVSCATIEMILPLAGYFLRKDIRALLAAEEPAMVFVCTADRMWQWNPNAPDELLSSYRRRRELLYMYELW